MQSEMIQYVSSFCLDTNVQQVINTSGLDLMFFFNLALKILFQLF